MISSNVTLSVENAAIWASSPSPQVILLSRILRIKTIVTCFNRSENIKDDNVPWLRLSRPSGTEALWPTQKTSTFLSPVTFILLHDEGRENLNLDFCNTNTDNRIRYSRRLMIKTYWYVLCFKKSYFLFRNLALALGVSGVWTNK